MALLRQRQGELVRIIANSPWLRRVFSRQECNRLRLRGLKFAAQAAPPPMRAFEPKPLEPAQYFLVAPI